MNPLEKHRPKTLEEYGSAIYVTTAVNWVKSVQAGHSVKPMLLLYGDAGCGKTTLARCLAESLGLEMADTNASEDRSSTSIRAAIDAAMNGTAVFLDEVDQIAGKEQRLVAKMAPSFKAPVILAANTENLERELKDLCIAIEVPKPSKQKLREIGQKVGASPRTILMAGSFRDLVHDSSVAVVGHYNEGDAVQAILRGDAEAGKTSDLMRLEAWVLDNTEDSSSESYDKNRARYRETGAIMEKYLRRSAARFKLQSPRFPWSLAARGRARRAREAEEAKAKEQTKAQRAAEKAEDLEALKRAQEMPSRPKVAEMGEWV